MELAWEFYGLVIGLVMFAIHAFRSILDLLDPVGRPLKHAENLRKRAAQLEKRYESAFVNEDSSEYTPARYYIVQILSSAIVLLIELLVVLSIFSIVERMWV